MTTVINLFGGSGVGKSTTAAGLFYEMKKLGLEVELVSEYVKKWAWTNRQVGAFDQVYIFGKQAKAEHDLYGKVDFIVTDSPLLLSPVYEKFYNNGKSIVESSTHSHLQKAKDSGVTHLNFLIPRTKPYNPKGRFETEDTAKLVDIFVVDYLKEKEVEYFKLTSIDQDAKVEEILRFLSLRR